MLRGQYSFRLISRDTMDARFICETLDIYPGNSSSQTPSFIAFLT